MTDVQVIKILAERADEAREALGKLVKKARRYASDEIAFAVGAPYTETRQIEDWDGSHRSVRVAVCDITVSGAAPRVGDYEFLARLEHEEGGVILQLVPGKDGVLDARFRDVHGPDCEHCKRVRARKDTYVVRHTGTGAQLQVGSTCLRDFLGIDSPTKVAARFAFLRELDQWRASEPGGFDFYQTLQFILGATATEIRLHGWLSNTKANETGEKSTSSAISVLWSQSKSDAVRKAAAELRRRSSPADDAQAAEALSWVRDELVAKSEYEHNLKVACASDVVVNPRRIGLICSAVPAFLRHQERTLKLKRERLALAGSTHVGAPKQRLRDIKARVTFIHWIGESYGRDRVLYKLLTEDGNVVTTFTEGARWGDDIRVGTDVVLTGTVKRHGEYKGVKETLLTRVEVEAVAGNGAAADAPCGAAWATP